MKRKSFSIYIDAVADPGANSSGIGVLIKNNKTGIACRICDSIDKSDVGRARSTGLKMALREIRKRNTSDFEICSDSEVFVRQLQGIYQVRDPILKQLRNAINTKFRDIEISIRLVSLEENRPANELAKKGLEKLRRTTRFGLSPLSMMEKKKKIPSGLKEDQEPEEDIQCSAGGVLYKKEGDKYRICLIAKRDFKVWALPKGRVAPGEVPEQTAVREVIEETGHLGKIEAKIDQIDYHFYWKENDTMYHKFVYFYLMPLERENARERDQEADAVRWFTLGDAYKMITYINEKEVIRKARKILEQS